MNEELDVFLATYIIGNGLDGGVSFRVNLLIEFESRAVSGKGKVLQPVNPPLNIRTDLIGDWRQLWVEGQISYIVNLNGYEPYPGVPPTGLIVPNNTKLTMHLGADWKSGSASFSYLQDGQWVHVDKAHAELVSSKLITEFEPVVTQ